MQLSAALGIAFKAWVVRQKSQLVVAGAAAAVVEATPYPAAQFTVVAIHEGVVWVPILLQLGVPPEHVAAPQVADVVPRKLDDNNRIKIIYPFMRKTDSQIEIYFF